MSSAALDVAVPLTKEEAQTIVQFMDGMKGYLTDAWVGIESLADEANSMIRDQRRQGGEEVNDEEVYDDIDSLRREAAKAIRFALESAKHIHEMLNDRAYGFGKFAVREGGT